jgi:hypothetical protein
MDWLNGEVGYCTNTSVTSDFDGNMLTGAEGERVAGIKESERVAGIKEEDQEETTIPVIKTEPNVSCVPVLSTLCVCGEHIVCLW